MARHGGFVGGRLPDRMTGSAPEPEALGYQFRRPRTKPKQVGFGFAQAPDAQREQAFVSVMASSLRLSVRVKAKSIRSAAPRQK